MKESFLKQRLGIFGVTVVFSAVACISSPVGWLLNFPRTISIRRKQKRALVGLGSEQQKLLHRLWKEEELCRRYQEAYSDGYFNLSKTLDIAVRRADETVRECHEDKIEEWRIDAFRIITYD
ncbi:MAG: hypothetical protein Q7S57_00405 [bacterium]|nr:hypothetical protein [bacterium]